MRNWGEAMSIISERQLLNNLKCGVMIALYYLKWGDEMTIFSWIVGQHIPGDYGVEVVKNGTSIYKGNFFELEVCDELMNLDCNNFSIKNNNFVFYIDEKNSTGS